MLQIQDGRVLIVNDAILGTISVPALTVMTLTVAPDKGNVLLNGVSMIVSATATIEQIRNGEVTFLSSSGILGATTFTFFDGTNSFQVDIELIVGIIGNLFVIAKTTPVLLTLTDEIPREIPAILAAKLAHEIAARLLARGDRQSDDQMAVGAAAKFFEAKIDAISNINKIGGAFRQMRAN